MEKKTVLVKKKQEVDHKLPELPGRQQEKNVQEIQDQLQDQLKELLTCEICKDVFNEPVTLLCNHTFCQYCIHQLVEKSKPKQQDGMMYMQLPNAQDNACPKCTLKIWLPPTKSVNYTIRDLVKTIYGEHEYEQIKKERSVGILKTDIHEQAVEQIKEEMWRSISDNLNLTKGQHMNNSKSNFGLSNSFVDDVGPLHHNLGTHGLGYVKPYPNFSSSSLGGQICRYYNSVYGCKAELCQYRHDWDTNLLVQHITELRQLYPFLQLDYDEQICQDFNSLEGCQGDNCRYKHVYSYSLLKETLEDLRKLDLIERSQIKEPETMFEFGKKMVLICTLLVSCYLWWKMRK